MGQSPNIIMDKKSNNFSEAMKNKKDLCELDPDEMPFYTEEICLALADEDEDAIHSRIENLCQRIEEKQKFIKLKREELRNLEVDSDVEVFEMKHEIFSLQTKIDEDDETIPKKLAGKGWRNSVIQRRIYGRLTKSAKKEAEEWARQTKRTLVMELIKQRKHTWISRPKRQQTDEQVLPAEENGGLCYEEHNGVIEIEVDAKIVPTYSFEEIRNQIEEKWKEEIKTKMADIHERKNSEQDLLHQKLESVQMAAEKEKDVLQKEHDDRVYSLNKMNELLKKMLLNEKHDGEQEQQSYEIDAAFLKTEFECPICFEEMKPPMRIWQCVDGHPVCEGCRNKLESKGCPSCNRCVEGRNIALEKMARSLYGDHY